MCMIKIMCMHVCICDYVNICMCLVLLCIFGKKPNSNKVFLSSYHYGISPLPIRLYLCKNNTFSRDYDTVEVMADIMGNLWEGDNILRSITMSRVNHPENITFSYLHTVFF